MNLGGQDVSVEISNTNDLRAIGLSGRKSLGEREGMLFIFEESDAFGFWMKDMNFSIDIVWINDLMQVVGMEENVSPDTFPKIFYPPVPIRYVLELPSGYLKEHPFTQVDF